MTTLITGAGLLGQAAARLLQDQGKPVLLLDVRQPDGMKDLPVMVGDVSDWPWFEHIVRAQGVKSIVHTAAMLTPGMRGDPLAGIRTNVMGTAHVLEAARRFALQRVVIASSTTVTYTAFGTLPRVPIPEDFVFHSVSEAPGSLYACTKLTAEHLALSYTRQHGVDAVVLRIGAVLGIEGKSATSVPGKMMEKLVNAGMSGEPAHFEDPALLWGGIEEFIDARDCARAIVAALDAADPLQRIYNVATGVGYTFEQVVQAVRQVLPKLQVDHAPLPQGGLSGFPSQRPAPSDISAAGVELGFRPQHDLADTVGYLADLARCNSGEK